MYGSRPDPDHLEAARELLETQLEAAHYLVREIAVIDREPDSVELVATLAASAADPAELDRLTARLDAVAFIQHASWGLRSPD